MAYRVDISLPALADAEEAYLWLKEHSPARVRIPLKVAGDSGDDDHRLIQVGAVSSLLLLFFRLRQHLTSSHRLMISDN